MLETIRARRDEIEARYGIRLLGVVGSVARGEERADSDVDIAFSLSYGSAPRFSNLLAPRFELEEASGRPVDLV